MRLLVLTLVVLISACGSHRRPPPPPASPILVTRTDAPTQEHCAAMIQDIVDHMNSVDFNKDRKGEITKDLTKARAEQAKGRFDKCVGYAKKAIYWSR